MSYSLGATHRWAAMLEVAKLLFWSVLIGRGEFGEAAEGRPVRAW